MIYNLDDIVLEDAYSFSNALDEAYHINGKMCHKKYELVFSDEFNSSAIDSQKWSLRSGYYSKRYYMPEDYSNNAYCEAGNLVIKNVKDHPVKDRNWSGAFIETRGKYYFQYGKVEARIKFPSDSQKYHATLWLMGKNYDSDGWPYCGEIDAAETDDGSISASLHYENSAGEHVSKHIGKYPNIDVSEWHTYEMIWTSDDISIYVDGIKVGSVDLNEFTVGDYNPFRQPHFIMFNSNPYGINDDENEASVTTVTNYIDYIKIYQ